MKTGRTNNAGAIKQYFRWLFDALSAPARPSSVYGCMVDTRSLERGR
jgi:hypothetical protein